MVLLALPLHSILGFVMFLSYWFIFTKKIYTKYELFDDKDETSI